MKLALFVYFSIQLFMRSFLAPYLASDASMRVLRALSLSPKARGIREVADLCGLSPRGAQIVLAGLIRRGIIAKKRPGKRTLFTANLNRKDQELLAQITALSETAIIEDRADTYSRDAREILAWIDPTLKIFKQTRKPKHGTDRPA